MTLLSSEFDFGILTAWGCEGPAMQRVLRAVGCRRRSIGDTLRFWWPLVVVAFVVAYYRRANLGLDISSQEEGEFSFLCVRAIVITQTSHSCGRTVVRWSHCYVYSSFI